ncbi:MAG: hypothetical protein ACLTFZ_03340 [Lachnospiraceae bacterium]
MKGGSGGYYICYMDADGNPKDYYSNEEATQTYDSEGNLIATGTVDFNGFFESQHCYVEITAQEAVLCRWISWIRWRCISTCFQILTANILTDCLCRVDS